MGTKVYTSKDSVKIYGDNTEDVIKKAKIRAILGYIKDTAGNRYYDYWLKEMFFRKGQMKSYYRYAAQGHYYLGLPTFTVQGETYDNASIAAAVNTDLGGTTYDVLDAKKQDVDIDLYWEWKLQESPYYYQPFAKQLTYNNKTDWSIVSTYWYDNITFPQNSEYRADLVRSDKDVSFWLEEMPTTATEGNTLTYTLHSNVIMPRGTTCTVGLVYSGTLAASRYTAPVSVDMPELSDSTTFDITLNEDAIDDVSGTLTVTLGTITDNTPTTIFKSTTAWVSHDSRTTTVYDNDTLVLSVDSQVVGEAGLTSIVLPVVLHGTASAAFTVDYATADGTAIGGTDYTDQSGTLSFTGTDGESQNITVPWIGDVADGTTETFTLTLSNSSDVTVELVGTATIEVLSTIPTIPVVTKDPDETLTISLPGLYDGDQELLVVRYYDTLKSDKQWYWWFYDYTLNTYTGLEPILDTGTIDDMYPAGIIRRQKAFINADKTTTAYKTTRSLLTRIGLDIDEMSTNIAQQSGYEDVDDAFANLSISPSDTHPLISLLLFRHFEYIIEVLNVSSASGEYKTYFVEQDANNETVWYDHSILDDQPGTIPGNPGLHGYSHEVFSEIGEYYYNWQATDTQDPYVPIYYDWLYIYYQKTETTYKKIALRNLRAKSRISYGGKTRYKINGLVTRAGYYGQPDVDDPQNLTIPLSRNLVTTWLDYEDQMVVFQYIFRIDVYAIQIVRTRWYQSGLFKGLFTFAAIAVTIYSLGTATTLVAALESLVINYLVIRLVVYVAELTGNEALAVAVGVIAMIALADAGFISGFEIGTADQLINTVTQFSNLFTAAETGVVNNIQEKTDAINKDIEKLNAELGPDDSISGEFFASLVRSNDTQLYSAIELQYDYDSMLSGAFDRLVTNYYEQMLVTGIL